MAQGNITAKLTDIHLDYARAPAMLTATVVRYMEDSDGTLNSIETTTVQLPVPDLTLYFKAQLKTDIVTAVKAQNAKLPTTIN